jgi:hypothetical protein
MDRNVTMLVAVTLVAGCDSSVVPEGDASPPRDASMEASVPSGPKRDAAPSDPSPSDDGAAWLVLPAQFTEEDMPLRMLNDGDPIDLWAAPQGGHVVLVAAKVKNFHADTAILRVRARYPDTPFIVAEEARSVKMVPVPGEPDTMQPDLHTRTQVAHVPLCPDYDPMDIVDRPIEFTVQISSAAAPSQEGGAVTVRLVPTCVAGVSRDATCRCECSADYFLGKCGRDGGTDGATPTP